MGMTNLKIIHIKAMKMLFKAIYIKFSQIIGNVHGGRCQELNAYIGIIRSQTGKAPTLNECPTSTSTNLLMNMISLAFRKKI